MISDLKFANQLYVEYENYLETSLKERRFKHRDIIPLINKLRNKNIFAVRKIGDSTEGREINLISYGKGKTKVFLWSQMHGDEPTATMAIFDILNFLSSNNEFKDFRDLIFKGLTIYFLPMVNPDGAEKFTRRNIFDIDINRDALRLESKEAKLLMKTFIKLKADFGFNLHDQDRHYSAGKTFKPATISFLAPPPDEFDKNTNVRKDAAKLIAKISNILTQFIPGHIAKYSDEYEPRAFGDTFQKLGTSTILIESGGWKNDPEKQFIRKLNFVALLFSFKSIAEKSYKKESLKNYDKIPFNSENLRDVIIRNVILNKNGKSCLVDLAVNFEEESFNKFSNFFFVSELVDIGDLSTFYGYEDYDFKGMKVEPGKTFPRIFNNLDELNKIDVEKLYKKGYTNIRVRKIGKNGYNANRPFNIISEKSGFKGNEIKLTKTANFVFKKRGQIQFIMVNGFLHNLKYAAGEINNGLIVY